MLAAAQSPATGEGVIKLILSRGVEHGPAPTAWVTTAEARDNSAARSRGIRVVTLDRGYDSEAPARAPWLLLGAKTLSYAVNMAALREAHRRGADDAIFVSSDGFVLEAPTASVILRFGDRFVTPEPGGSDPPRDDPAEPLRAPRARTGTTSRTRRSRPRRSPPRTPRGCVSSVRLAAPVTAIDGAEVAVDAELTADFNRYLLSPRD